MDFRTTIGLETHVQLKTRTKIWCSCPNVEEAEPNTAVCPVCLGYPGTLPVFNAEAARLVAMTGMMLNCRVNPFSKFDRKNYYYPDMPKNYQISQYDQPFCEEGWIEIDLEGTRKRIGITRIHLEEDVGKSIHASGGSLVDFNRAGTPLMEIVTDPDLASPEEAHAYLLALKAILQYGDISHCNLEMGNIRCDLNCSVRPSSQEQLGTKTEIKNMNTFKGVYRALRYEVQRQREELQNGGVIVQETRRWDDDAGITSAMRTKEYAHDYRYFPEPDLVPVELTEDQLAEWRAALPELPEARRNRMVAEYGLPEYDAGVLAGDRALADFFEATAEASGNAKAASNWIMTEILRILSEDDREIGDLDLTPEALAGLIRLVDDNTINNRTGKDVLVEMLASGASAEAIVKEKGLAQVSDTGAIEAFADQAIAENPKSVEDYRAGKKNAIQHLMGQVMRLSRGKANPKMVMELLRDKLESG